MDEDPDGSLRAAQHPRDLGRRHLVDESQDEGPPSVGGQTLDGGPGGPGLVAEHDLGFGVAVRDERSGRLETCLGMPSSVASLVGDNVSGDPHQPHSERRRALAGFARRPLVKAGHRGERGKECSLGRVLGVMVIAELVVGVAVDLGHVPPI